MKPKSKWQKNVDELLNLENFNVSRTRGFLQDTDPISCLPREFEALDQIVNYLPGLNERKELRKFIKDFPMLDNVDELEGPELMRAMTILHFVQSSYVLGEGVENNAKSIPKQIAVPTYKATKKFGLDKPILNYATYSLFNYRLFVPDRGFDIDNLDTMVKFTDNQNEIGFIRVHAAIEAAASPALAGIGKIKYDMIYNSPAKVAESIWEVAGHMSQARSKLSPMWDECKPDRYIFDVRPWIQMFKNVVYEGVKEYEEKPMSFRGETGAQSSILPAMDASFGIKHDSNLLTKHLEEMLDYMPPGHKDFITSCGKKPSIRDYVLKNKSKNLGLRDGYNQLIDAVYGFRAEHRRLAQSYIADADPKEETGTGGTPFKRWLNDLRDETTLNKIK